MPLVGMMGGVSTRAYYLEILTNLFFKGSAVFNQSSQGHALDGGRTWCIDRFRHFS